MMSPQAPSAGRIHRSRSDPRLEQLRPSGSEPPSPPPSPSGRVDQVFFSPGPHGDNMFSPAIQLPKRLKFIDFWVSTRIFQRAIMVSALFVDFLFIIYIKVIYSVLVHRYASNCGHVQPTHFHNIVCIYGTVVSTSKNSFSPTCK